MAYKPFRPDISIAMVLDMYEITYPSDRGEKDEASIPCPFCESDSRSLNINFDRSVFKCHRSTCGKSGGTFKFVAAYEHVTIDAAKKVLDKRFPGSSTLPKAAVESAGKSSKTHRVRGKTQLPDASVGDSVSEQALHENPVLKFELKNIDQEHPSLNSLGLPDAVLDAFEIGYYSGRGSLKDSIVMPVRRSDGAILAYLGLDSQRNVVYPPDDKFDRRSDVFGLNFPSTYNPSEPLYVVKNPVDVLVCAAYNCPAVATMSTCPSHRDLKMIRDMLTNYTNTYYLIRDDQTDEEIGEICRLFAEDVSTTWSIRSLDRLFLSQ